MLLISSMTLNDTDVALGASLAMRVREHFSSRSLSTRFKPLCEQKCKCFDVKRWLALLSTTFPSRFRPHFLLILLGKGLSHWAREIARALELSAKDLCWSILVTRAFTLSASAFLCVFLGFVDLARLFWILYIFIM